MHGIRALIVLLLLGLSVSADPVRGEVRVLNAASVTGLISRVRVEFEKQNPDSRVLMEPGASLLLARKVLDLQQQCDLLILADRSILGTVLPSAMVTRSQDFLTDRIGILVGKNAKYSSEITAANWPQILTRPDVRVGISDPEIAPAGYRTLMVWKLASIHYKKLSLYDTLKGRISNRTIRPNAAALLVLLEAGEIDYAFDYVSLGTQNGMRVIELPPAVNLGDPAFTEVYRTAAVEVPGSAPGTRRVVHGEPIVYTMVLLKNAKNPAGGSALMDFLLGARGRALAEESGQTPLPGGQK